GGGVPVPPQPPATPGVIEAGIAAVAAGLVPAGATVQYGVGGIPDAVVTAISRPVAVLSGLIGTAVANLHDRGLLVGAAMASYAWGDESLVALAREGRVRAVGVEALHAGGRLAATPQLVSINAALQVGLDGAVNIERVGGRLVAGIGGHADYSAAATQSPGGFSMVALASTHRDRSTIVARPEVVSTSRTDIHMVVTEHGVADLRGLTDAGRREAIAAVAHPDHRAGLGQTLGT
ncbi:MAG: hypothetical protein JF603_06750, partial [Acidobacteria bacterium]|nr:hypothetical protein [Acidobacteriota bacterium]